MTTATLRGVHLNAKPQILQMLRIFFFCMGFSGLLIPLISRICSGTKIEVCKYYESHSGCIRGSKCFYAHGEEQHRKMNPGMCMIHASTQEFKSKIFVGGLPFFLDSGEDHVTFLGIRN